MATERGEWPWIDPAPLAGPPGNSVDQPLFPPKKNGENVAS